VVDLDLAQFFDRVHHQRLLDRMSQRVADRRILDLIRRMLKSAVVMPDGTRIETVEGTPQGDPLSPFLSSIVLDEFDQEMARRGLRFVRYADDANVFVRSQRAGIRVMSSLRQFLEERLRLQVNEEKSAVRKPEQVHFIGFSFRCTEGVTSIEVSLSKKSKRRLMTTIREMTPPNWGKSIVTCMAEISRYLNGWSAYFRLCTAEVASELGVIDAHVRRRLRAIIVRQKKRPRFLFRYLVSRGVSRQAAANTAYCGKGSWVMSNRPGLTRAYPPSWFHARMISLKTRWHELTPPRVKDQFELAL
jgi:RNA-directed DNA polymerase